MEVTVSNLRHWKRIHWRLLETHALFNTNKLHLVTAADEEEVPLCLREFAESFITVKAPLPFEFILSPGLLELLSDVAELCGKADDDELHAFAMRLGREGKLTLSLSASLYQRLGVEGVPITSSKSQPELPYRVVLDLHTLHPGQAKRTRLLQLASEIWNGAKINWTLVCSPSTWSRLKSLLAEWEKDLAVIEMNMDFATVDVPPAPSPALGVGVPSTEEVEYLSLWMGVITCKCLLLDDKKVDPFISMCTWPATEPTKKHRHYTMNIPGGMVPVSKISELIEALARRERASITIAGNDGRGQRGFLMQIDPATEAFLFCSA